MRKSSGEGRRRRESERERARERERRGQARNVRITGRKRCPPLPPDETIERGREGERGR